MWRRIRPQETVGKDELAAGMRMLLYDGICTQVMGVMVGGAFLVAFAIQLGASNLVIGIIAALGPLTQILQVPTIFLLERTGFRKALVISGTSISRLFWFAAAAVPLVVSPPLQIGMFLLAISLYYALGTVSGLAYNSWMRDLIPDEVRGSYMGRRLTAGTAVAAFLGLTAGAGVDLYKQFYPEIGIYCIYFVFGGGVGLLGVWFLLRIPEPRMERSRDIRVLEILAEPVRDRNFRRLMVFMGSWSFAVHLAAPFFVVYMLKRLDLSMTVILALAVASQFTNILFFRLWGRLADRFSNKSVLAEAGPLFIFTFLLWPFTTLTDKPLIYLPLLLLIHLLAGISTAGVTLAAGNIALELSPRGKATAYLAVNALVSGIAATIAPILGGAAATVMEGRELILTLSWLNHLTGESWALPTFHLRGLDFLFLAAFLVGIYSLHRLALVREEGEVEKGVVMGEVIAEVRKSVRNVSNIAGLLNTFYFPYARLLELVVPKKERK